MKNGLSIVQKVEDIQVKDMAAERDVCATSLPDVKIQTQARVHT